MKIAVCDNELSELTYILDLLHNYRQNKKVCFTYKSFSSGCELLEGMQLETFDLLFLDILMPEKNGIQVAHNIRTFDENIKIIFLTSSTEFAIESYSVGAYSYLLKPITKELLFPLLDKLFTQIQSCDESILIKCKTGITRILFSELSYVEVLGKVLSFHLSNGHIYKVIAPLSEYERTILAHPEFLRVHRAFLVNLWQMRELTSREFITLNNESVPVSRRKHAYVKDAFIKSIFTKKGG